MRRRTALGLFSAGVVGAQEILEKKPAPADLRMNYGDAQSTFGDLRLPPGKGPFPLVVNIHGGFWRAKYDLEHNGHLCEALRAKGVATWSLEYRRIGNEGGGWPGTFEDAKLGANHVRGLVPKFPIDLKRTIAMGHSAGGHLALLLGGELDWLVGVIALAGVADLRRAFELKLSDSVVRDFLGGTPDEVPERYRAASPIERLPMKKQAVLIHGDKDVIVPIEIAEGYEQAALKAGDKVKLLKLEGAGHFDLIDPASPHWATVERSVLEMLRIS